MAIVPLLVDDSPLRMHHSTTFDIKDVPPCSKSATGALPTAIYASLFLLKACKHVAIKGQLA
jgi:hypothetical protein